MALLGKKKAEGEIPNPVAAEGRQLERLGDEAYRWLGNRYAWYNKIRTAKKGGLPFFNVQNLEEQMEATRAALRLVERSLNVGLVLAFNGTLEELGKTETPLEGLPDIIEMPDRGNPPSVPSENDALIVAFMPLRFLNLAKTLRDQGKGIDFYTEGLIKKLFFKVAAFYADTHHWEKERLAFFLADLPADAPLATINDFAGRARQNR